MTLLDALGAAHDLERYVKAMIAGDVDTCIVIEQNHGLYGETPETVCTALRARAAHDTEEK